MLGEVVGAGRVALVRARELVAQDLLEARAMHEVRAPVAQQQRDQIAIAREMPGLEGKPHRAPAIRPRGAGCRGADVSARPPSSRARRRASRRR